jgi:hypothetical protein
MNLGAATLTGIDGSLATFMAKLGILGRIGTRHSGDNMTVQADQAEIVFSAYLWHRYFPPRASGFPI